MTGITRHILGNLDEDLSLDSLCRESNLSRFHFLRTFQDATGLSPGGFVRQARLKRASLQLVYDRRRRITDIAQDAGFEFAESFARAFRRQYGQTPSGFRRQPDWEQWWQVHHIDRTTRQETDPMQVKIVNFPETRVAALEHHGPESQTYKSTAKFIEWRKANGMPPGKGNTYGIHYTDPSNTFPEDFRLDICVSVDREVAENPQGVVNKIIPACRCAVARHVGSRERVLAAEYLVLDWLPESGEQMGDYPIFFHYVNVGPNIPESAMITDVYLPLK